MRLYELASLWVKTNCPAPRVQADILRKFESSLQAGLGIAFVIGERLTKSRKPYLLQVYCGELFIFQLTERQARQHLRTGAMVMEAIGTMPQYHGPCAERPVRLVHVVFDHSNALDMTGHLSGTVTVASEHSWFVPLAIQVVCDPVGGGSAVHYHHFNALPSGTTTIPFTVPGFAEILDRKGRRFDGAVPLFVQICVVGEPELDFLPTSIVSKKAKAPRGPTGPSAKRALRQEKLGTPYPVPPTALAKLALAATKLPLLAAPSEQLVHSSAQSHLFRAISDIRTVLVEVA